MKILRVLNVGEKLQKTDYCMNQTECAGRSVTEDMGYYCRFEEVPDVYYAMPANVSMGSSPDKPSYCDFKIAPKDTYNGMYNHNNVPVYVTLRESIPMESATAGKNLNAPSDAQGTSREVWRLLEIGETIRNGDEFLMVQSTNNWRPINFEAIGKAVNSITPATRRLELFPAPFIRRGELTPIAFSERMPEEGQRIFVYDETDLTWWSANNYQRAKYSSDDYTHWLPQDALPVPVAEKSLADELEAWADNITTPCSAVGLLRRAAKELRK